MKKRLIYILIISLILLLAIIYLFVYKSPKVIECSDDSDCVPNSCCHPDSCVSINQKPDCTWQVCSFNCEGPLDCGAGTCGCAKNKCKIISNAE